MFPPLELAVKSKWQLVETGFKAGHFFGFKDPETFCVFPSLLVLTECVTLWSRPEETPCDFFLVSGKLRTLQNEMDFREPDLPLKWASQVHWLAVLSSWLLAVTAYVLPRVFALAIILARNFL